MRDTVDATEKLVSNWVCQKWGSFRSSMVAEVMPTTGLVGKGGTSEAFPMSGFKAVWTAGGRCIGGPLGGTLGVSMQLAAGTGESISGTAGGTWFAPSMEPGCGCTTFGLVMFRSLCQFAMGGCKHGTVAMRLCC